MPSFKAEAFVRPAIDADTSVIAELWTAAFVREHGVSRPAFSQSDFRAAAAMGDVFAAEHQERLVGAVALVAHGKDFATITRPQESQVMWLAVDQASRGSGIAALLMEQCAARARQRGDAAVVLWTRSSMRSAQRLYKRLRYIRVPERDDVPGLGRQLVYRLAL